MKTSTSLKIRKITSWLITFLIVTATTSCINAQGNSADIDWLIDVLELEKGSVVADIGAGDGDQTLEIARHIGPDGLIYSTELGSNSMEDLRDGLEDADVDNIKVLEGHPTQTNLPAECCDAIYMRRVYHHFTDPAAMNASLLESLKPGGRLAIIDFEPRGSEADPEDRSSGSSHGVTNETVVEELERAGFTLISSDQRSGRDIYVVMQKPDDSN